MPPFASDPAAVGTWRHLWAAYWSTSPLSRAARIVLIVVVVAVMTIDVARAALAGETSGTTDLLSLSVAAAIGLFVWRPTIAAVVLVAGAVVALSFSAGDVWLVGMAVAAGIVVVTCSVPLSVTYVAAFLIAIVVGESARQDVRPLGVVVVLLVVAAASCLGGSFLRAARRRQQALVRRLSAEAAAARSAVQEERLRIADELHDFIAHQLTIIVMHARVLARAEDPDLRAAARTAIEDAAVQALADIRRVLDATQVRRSSFDDGDEAVDQRYTMAEALSDARRDLSGIVDRVTVRDGLGGGVELSRTIDAGLAHIVREATTNIVKHGGGGAVDIEVLQRSDGVQLTVVNDVAAPGDGLHLPRGGYGVARMRERALLSGGTFRVGPRDGRWAVVVTVPLR